MRSERGRLMKRLLKTGMILSAAAVFAGLLTGCGEQGAKQKIGKEARYYIAIDWTSEDCLKDEELMRETVVGLESDSYTNGYSKIRSSYRYVKGELR